MNRLLITFVFCIVIISCKLTDIYFNGYSEDEVVVSYVHNDDSYPIKYSFESDDTNLICLGFRKQFNDTIEVFINNEREILFYKNDSITNVYDSYDQPLFKYVRLKKLKNYPVRISLKQNKRMIEFKLDKKYKLYIISRADDVWYVTVRK